MTTVNNTTRDKHLTETERHEMLAIEAELRADRHMLFFRLIRILGLLAFVAGTWVFFAVAYGQLPQLWLLASAVCVAVAWTAVKTAEAYNTGTLPTWLVDRLQLDKI